MERGSDKMLRNRHIFVLDIIFCLLAYMLAVIIVFPISALGKHMEGSMLLIAITTVIYLTMFIVFGIYRVDWVFSGAKEYIFFIFSMVISAILSMFAGVIFNHGAVYPELNVAANIYNCIYELCQICSSSCIQR